MAAVKSVAKLKRGGLGAKWNTMLRQLRAAQPGFTLDRRLKKEAKGASLAWASMCAVLTARQQRQFVPCRAPPLFPFSPRHARSAQTPPRRSCMCR
eukprot:COSAG05_NODE_611_length_8359_cov_5.328935_3_plen_96_part_00